MSAVQPHCGVCCLPTVIHYFVNLFILLSVLWIMQYLLCFSAISFAPACLLHCKCYCRRYWSWCLSTEMSWMYVISLALYEYECVCVCVCVCAVRRSREEQGGAGRCSSVRQCCFLPLICLCSAELSRGLGPVLSERLIDFRTLRGFGNTSSYIHTHTTHACTHACTYTRTHARTHTNACLHTRLGRHTHRHTDTHTHTHKCMPTHTFG